MKFIFAHLSPSLLLLAITGYTQPIKAIAASPALETPSWSILEDTVKTVVDRRGNSKTDTATLLNQSADALTLSQAQVETSCPEKHSTFVRFNTVTNTHKMTSHNIYAGGISPPIQVGSNEIILITELNLSDEPCSIKETGGRIVFFNGLTTDTLYYSGQVGIAFVDPVKPNNFRSRKNDLLNSSIAKSAKSNPQYNANGKAQAPFELVQQTSGHLFQR
jgi:hypothetical protein